MVGVERKVRPERGDAASAMASFEAVNVTATLFEADETEYAATVEVIGVIFAAADDGYAVLEVEDSDTGEGFALVGPVAHLNAGDRAEVSGEWQTHWRPAASYAPAVRCRSIRPIARGGSPTSRPSATSGPPGPSAWSRSTASPCSPRSPPTRPASSARCAG